MPKESLPDETERAERERRSAIVRVMRPLIEGGIRSGASMECAAADLGVSLRTAYTYRKKLESLGLFSSSLERMTPGPKLGSSRYDNEVDEIIDEVIMSNGLTRQQVHVTELMRLVHDECRRRHIPRTSWPKIKGVTARFNKISLLKLETKRGRRREAEKYEATPGEFPMPSRPNDVWLIDHTLADICLVDREQRMGVGKATLSMILDAYTRMVAGYWISLGHPSIEHTAMAMIHAVTEKGPWLQSLGLGHHRWPICGPPGLLYSDNAAEFHSTPVARGCAEFQIEQDWRPVGKPRYGALVERVIGTTMGEVHLLPGTTFSNPKQRGSYDSEKSAVMTLDEFDCWLALQIIKYHASAHKGLHGAAPISRWEGWGA